jgi:competence protein ComGC
VVEKKTLLISNLLEILMFVLREYTAGNPMKINVLWTNLTLIKVQEKLKSHSISVSCPVIKKLLKMCGYVKRKMQKCKTLKEVENRNEQFEYIAKIKQSFVEKQLPVLSIDTKKKEYLGNFYREGKVYCQQAQAVNDHDFNSFSNGIAIPHGIYDIAQNTCHLSIGASHDTAEFVADNIDYHWNTSIKAYYPDAKKMLILCDGGGSNHSNHYVVKEQFKLLAHRLQMEIIVAHYPPYCSKWNPIEHRAFSFISKKWQGIKFDTCNIIKELAEQTTTKTGFSVKAMINSKQYETGRKATDKFMKTMPVIFNNFLPKWNYRFEAN